MKNPSISYSIKNFILEPKVFRISVYVFLKMISNTIFIYVFDHFLFSKEKDLIRKMKMIHGTVDPQLC